MTTLAYLTYLAIAFGFAAYVGRKMIDDDGCGWTVSDVFMVTTLSLAIGVLWLPLLGLALLATVVVGPSRIRGVLEIGEDY